MHHRLRNHILYPVTNCYRRIPVASWHAPSQRSSCTDQRIPMTFLSHSNFTFAARELLWLAKGYSFFLGASFLSCIQWEGSSPWKLYLKKVSIIPWEFCLSSKVISNSILILNCYAKFCIHLNAYYYTQYKRKTKKLTLANRKANNKLNSLVASTGRDGCFAIVFLLCKDVLNQTLILWKVP